MNCQHLSACCQTPSWPVGFEFVSNFIFIICQLAFQDSLWALSKGESRNALRIFRKPAGPMPRALSPGSRSLLGTFKPRLVGGHPSRCWLDGRNEWPNRLNELYNLPLLSVSYKTLLLQLQADSVTELVSDPAKLLSSSASRPAWKLMRILLASLECSFARAITQSTCADRPDLLAAGWTSIDLKFKTLQPSTSIPSNQ